MSDKKIKILENGPYLVTGGIPLEEQRIELGENNYIYKTTKKYPKEDRYMLCRCGKSKNYPFCDGTHSKIKFNGKLTASNVKFKERAKRYYGKNLILEDVKELCAFARFCHSKEGDVWQLIEKSDSKITDLNAIKMACDCPSGRLVMVDKESNTDIEPTFEPSIVLIDDPLRNCTGPIWVRGYIPIEDANGNTFEIRNRVTLCRCGMSNNKPFCDSEHVHYNKKQNSII